MHRCGLVAYSHEKPMYVCLGFFYLLFLIIELAYLIYVNKFCIGEIMENLGGGCILIKSKNALLCS